MKSKNPKIIMFLRITWGLGMAIIGGGGTFTLAYFITKWFYSRTEIRLPDYVGQLVNSILGGILFMIIMVAIGILTRPKQLAFWSEIIEALKRIAKGDFNVTIDWSYKYDGRFGNFVQAINQMAQDLKQMELLRQEFISNVSHEIQSPLTSIRGFAGELHNNDLTPEERKHYLSIIETESTRLSKLSDNLLKLTSLESEHQPFDPHPFRLDSQLRHVVLACEPQWLEKSLEVEMVLTDNTTIVADKELMHQVWMNLIHNAIKFTPSGGSLTIRLETEENQVRVRITDTGVGISTEDQLRIFERFYKGDKSRNRTEGGSGLGLSIVKKIVELHHGNIMVESRPGAGSTFQVLLSVQSVQ